MVSILDFGFWISDFYKEYVIFLNFALHLDPYALRLYTIYLLLHTLHQFLGVGVQKLRF